MNKFKRAVALLTLAACLLPLCGCLRFSGNLISTPAQRPTSASPYVYNERGGNVPAANATSAYVVPTQAYEIPTAAPVIPSETQPAAQQPVETQPAQQPAVTQPAQQQSDATDPSGWSKDQIIAYLQQAVNKSKDSADNMTVDHTEEFNIEIDRVPGGSAIKNLANSIIAGVIKPTNETLQYAGGQATNTDKETVPLLLPKRQKFNLPSSGVKEAKAAKNGNDIVIDITLVEELGTLTDVPQYNAGSVGYLSTGDVDLSLVTVEKLEITYFGSTIHAVINQSGLVTLAEYHIPIRVYGAGGALMIKGEFECHGEEKEVWKMNW
ncbi:MAG: hypothetical protein IJJ85_02570 [Clostridia bacterium]|nr:hypothetical protein [Clostridia bacterium]